MEEHELLWPAWRVGMKTGDLFTTLHDRYNTMTYTIQDPEAFHHDVYEISRDADGQEHFLRLMGERKQQRQDELQSSLKMVAAEIAGRPKLIGSLQWQYAMQLFRTMSYDSIIRYFASYVPESILDHPEREPISPPASTCATSESAARSAITSSSDAASVSGSDAPALSSNTPDSVGSPASIVDFITHDPVIFNPPSRTPSFSDHQCDDDGLSEREACWQPLACAADPPLLHGSDGNLGVNPCSTQQCSPDKHREHHINTPTPHHHRASDFAARPTSPDVSNPETPTPQQGSAAGACYMDHKTVVYDHERVTTPKPSLGGEGTPRCSVPQSRRPTRRSPIEAQSKVRKPAEDSLRQRPKVRRRLHKRFASSSF